MAKTTDALTTPQLENEARAMFRALNANLDTFSQKIMVSKLKIQEGNERVDKDGKPVTNEFGEPVCWDDSYLVTYSALNGGGEHTTRVSQAQFMELAEGGVYLASGKIVYKLYKDAYNTTPTIEFTKFENYEEIFVAELAKLQLHNNGASAQK